MGEVWQARDTRPDRTVAIKFSNATFSDRFQRESRATATHNQPNGATVHDVDDNYLVSGRVRAIFADIQPASFAAEQECPEVEVMNWENTDCEEVASPAGFEPALSP